jgi:hypothetical protein
MITTFSNERKIQRGLALLGCSPSAFCKLAGVCGKTRFMEAMNGLPGRHFSDTEAQALLSFLERLWELQAAVDEASRDAFGRTSHVPLDFTRGEEIGNALTIRLAQKCLVEDGDHALDTAAELAIRALGSWRDHNLAEGERK